MGHSIGVPQTYYYSERIQDRIIRFVTFHSALSEKCFREMLLITDQMPRTSALSLTVKRGVVQVERSTGGLSDALDALHCRILARKECMISSPISRNV